MTWTTPAAPGIPDATDPGATDPGARLSSTALILAAVLPFIGLVLSVRARRRSRAAGFTNGCALTGILVSTSLLLLSAATMTAAAVTIS